MTTSHYRVSEIVLACLAIAWGLWLIAFGTYYTSPVLKVFREWDVPEWMMVLYPLQAGIFMIVLPRHYRRYCHAMMASFWLFIAFSIAETDYTLTAVPTYATYCVLHVIRFVLVNHAPQ